MELAFQTQCRYYDGTRNRSELVQATAVLASLPRSPPLMSRTTTNCSLTPFPYESLIASPWFQSLHRSFSFLYAPRKRCLILAQSTTQYEQGEGEELEPEGADSCVSTMAHVVLLLEQG